MQCRWAECGWWVGGDVVGGEVSGGVECEVFVEGFPLVFFEMLREDLGFLVDGLRHSVLM